MKKIIKLSYQITCFFEVQLRYLNVVVLEVSPLLVDLRTDPSLFGFRSHGH